VLANYTRQIEPPNAGLVEDIEKQLAVP